MSYKPLFDWKRLDKKLGSHRPDGAVGYLYDDDLALAVNVSLAAERPLLLSGSPGTGKSTLAADVAWKLGRQLYVEVITSRTKAQDLQWSFDAVMRLAVATSEAADKTSQLVDSGRFVKPGVLWQAFQPEITGSGADSPARPRAGKLPDAVVLLDEIDKAEPDVPNDLLVVLDQREFVVRETGQEVRAPSDLQVLVVITTNGERDLPPAFVRRCVSHTIQLPSEPDALRARMKSIVERHFPAVDAGLFGAVYDLYALLRSAAASKALREPSTAELLDAFQACEKLGIATAHDAMWTAVANKAIWKHAVLPAATADATAAPAKAGAAP